MATLKPEDIDRAVAFAKQDSAIKPLYGKWYTLTPKDHVLSVTDVKDTMDPLSPEDIAMLNELAKKDGNIVRFHDNGSLNVIVTGTPEISVGMANDILSWSDDSTVDCGTVECEASAVLPHVQSITPDCAGRIFDQARATEYKAYRQRLMGHRLRAPEPSTVSMTNEELAQRIKEAVSQAIDEHKAATQAPVAPVEADPRGAALMQAINRTERNENHWKTQFGQTIFDGE